MFDKWKKVLKHLDINENLLSAKDELLRREPFLSNSIQNVKQNHFSKTQMEKFCAEITQFEVVNGCFQATLRDLAGDEIQATLHSDCKDVVKAHKCRKGSVLVLRDVSVFAITNNRHYLVLMNSCVELIV